MKRAWTEFGLDGVHADAFGEGASISETVVLGGLPEFSSSPKGSIRTVTGLIFRINRWVSDDTKVHALASQEGRVVALTIFGAEN